jgi:hypothetical protein
VLIHAETGSGKTLAYLLPLLHEMDTSQPRQVYAYSLTLSGGPEGALPSPPLHPHTARSQSSAVICTMWWRDR